jgi:hypothetical protein
MNNKYTKISNINISFVMQGPVIKEKNITKNCCISIRKYFPESKIILSTWLNTDTHDLDIDEKIETHDPGANSLYYHNQKIPNNINRMIVSSFRGLIAVETKFSIKLRTDIYFQSNNLLKLLKIVNESSCKYTKRKILIPSNMATNPDRDLKLLFHPSDFFFAGLTEDLIELYNIPLMSDRQLNYFNFSKYNKNKNIMKLMPRFTSEQYLFYSFIKKKIKFDFKNAFDYSETNKRVHDEVFSNLFIMKRNTKIGMNCYKYPMNFFSSTLYYAYTEYEFEKLLGKSALIDVERLISNFVKFLKKTLLFISKKFYIKIKDYLIKNIT